MRWFLTLLLALPVYSASYYVAPNGLDTNPGSQAEPFLTIQKGLDTAQAGDAILLGAGTYATTNYSARSGSAGSKIVLDGQSAAQVHGLYLSHSNIVVKNITFAGRLTAWFLYLAKGAHFTTVSNCVFDGDANTNMGVALTWENPAPAEYPWGTNCAGGCLVISNVFREQWGGEGNSNIRAFGDSNIVAYNVFRDGYRCDWIQVWGRNSAIFGNTFSNLMWTELCGNHPDWFQIWGGADVGGPGYGASNIVVESNIVIGAESSTQIGMVEGQDNPNMSHVSFRNNLIVGYGSGYSVSASNVSFINNTFIDCATNGGFALIFTVATNSTFHDTNLCAGNNGRVLNNLFLNCGSSGLQDGWYIFWPDVFSGKADYNMVSKQGYLSVFTNMAHESVGDPGGWSLSEWWEDHGINGGNPLLGNYRPLVGSPLINTGTNLASEFTTDLDGNTRGTLWDIGAFEYEEASASTNTLQKVTLRGAKVTARGGVTFR